MSLAYEVVAIGRSTASYLSIHSYHPKSIGTFRMRLTLGVDEPHGRAVGPRRVTQQYLPHQNERFYGDSMGDAHSKGRSIALQNWW